LSAYIDTNVILARYIPTDPHSASCRRFFGKTKLKRLASSLSLLELTCVFSRLLEAGEIKLSPQIDAALADLSFQEKAQAMVEYTLKDCDVSVASADPIPLTISVLGSPFRVDRICLKALKLASQLRLKTLDTLHLAQASCLRDEGVQIEYFVTNDMEILARREQVSKTIQSKVLCVEEGLTP